MSHSGLWCRSKDTIKNLKIVQQKWKKMFLSFNILLCFEGHKIKLLHIMKHKRECLGVCDVRRSVVVCTVEYKTSRRCVLYCNCIQLERVLRR